MDFFWIAFDEDETAEGWHLFAMNAPCIVLAEVSDGFVNEEGPAISAQPLFEFGYTTMMNEQVGPSGWWW